MSELRGIPGKSEEFFRIVNQLVRNDYENLNRPDRVRFEGLGSGSVVSFQVELHELFGEDSRCETFTGNAVILAGGRDYLVKITDPRISRAIGSTLINLDPDEIREIISEEEEVPVDPPHDLLYLEHDLDTDMDLIKLTSSNEIAAMVVPNGPIDADALVQLLNSVK